MHQPFICDEKVCGNGVGQHAGGSIQYHSLHRALVLMSQYSPERLEEMRRAASYGSLATGRVREVRSVIAGGGGETVIPGRDCDLTEVQIVPVEYRRRE